RATDCRAAASFSPTKMQSKKFFLLPHGHHLAVSTRARAVAVRAGAPPSSAMTGSRAARARRSCGRSVRAKARQIYVAMLRRNAILCPVELADFAMTVPAPAWSLLQIPRIFAEAGCLGCPAQRSWELFQTDTILQNGQLKKSAYEYKDTNN
ncbi:MAG: hypothetical protein ONB51_11890, partial [candidate division KSB1 bacterium]|nr:hypothetical protein [candidate division KSB1 bacterium]